MPRNALRRYLRRLLLASAMAPLAGCGPPSSQCSPTEFNVFVAFPAGFQVSDAGVGDGGVLSPSDCQQLCSNAVNGAGQTSPYGRSATCRETTQQSVDGVTCTGFCLLFTGRRPVGLLDVAPLASDGKVGEWLARAAHLEAASVHAFRRLRRELSALGAPAELVRAATAAARDEARHARVTDGLARRYGARSAPVTVAPVGERALEAIAIENAVEGCVGETWGALVAMAQARDASDGAIRAAMRSIADDEVGHAELAWAVDRFCRGLLDEESSARVTAARREAARALTASLAAAPPDPELCRVAGVPTVEQARHLAGRLAADLWSQI